MNKLLKFLPVFLLLVISNIAHAKIPVYFGESDYLEKIDSVPAIVEGNEKYEFGHRVYIKWFIAGVYAKDEGYVLIKGDQYIPLNNEMIQGFQEIGYLPKELPKYSLSTMHLLKGYSLWIILVILIGYIAISSMGKKEEEVVQDDKVHDNKEIV